MNVLTKRTMFYVCSGAFRPDCYCRPESQACVRFCAAWLALHALCYLSSSLRTFCSLCHRVLSFSLFFALLSSPWLPFVVLPGPLVYFLMVRCPVFYFLIVYLRFPLPPSLP